MILAMTILEHLEKLFYGVPYNVLLGYIHLVGIITFLMYLAIKYRKDYWEGVKGKDGKLEMPDMIISLVLICYINIILADVFLGLHASQGVFWSIDAIMLFALTGRVYLKKNENTNNPVTKMLEATPTPEAPVTEPTNTDGPIEAKPDNTDDKDAYLA